MRLQGTWIRALRVFLEREEEVEELVQTLGAREDLRNSPVVVRAPDGLVEAVMARLRDEGVVALPDRGGASSPRADREREVSPPTSSLRVVMGHLRGGREVESEGDLVVVGNVNPDAYVRAGGSIFVLGEVYGVAYAGVPNRTDAVVVGLRIEPQQIGIADLLARSPYRVFPQKRRKAAASGLEVARYNAREGRIEIMALETYLRGGAS